MRFKGKEKRDLERGERTRGKVRCSALRVEPCTTNFDGTSKKINTIEQYLELFGKN